MNRPQKRTVVTLPLREHEPAHERDVHRRLAQSLAALFGGHYAGDHDPQRPIAEDAPLYFLPSTTIIGTAQAHSLGIRDASDLFGGVVDHPFICTKAISHPLISPDAKRPPGWSDAFTEQTRDSVLAGWTAFTADDAREGARRLLELGPARLKPVNATAGRGQHLLQRPADLDAALAEVDKNELAHCGLVIEAHLADVETLSVGQVCVGAMTITYSGTQRLVHDNRGESVYGGSTLTAVRGGFDALLALRLPDDVRRAVEQSRRYDEAALACFDSLFASRRNYDVAQGRDGEGCRKSGVLEQSWRVGGASAAEIAAMSLLADRPDLDCVEASTYEVFGADRPTDANATVLYDGSDPELGKLTKYVTVKPYGDS